MKNVALLVAGALAVPFAAAAQAFPGTTGQSSTSAVYTSTATPPYPVATGSGSSVQPGGTAVWGTGYTHIGTGAATASGTTPVGPTSSSSPPPFLGAGSKNAASGLLAGGVAVLAALAL